jgi:hypothetical protein
MSDKNKENSVAWIIILVVWIIPIFMVCLVINFGFPGVDTEKEVCATLQANDLSHTYKSTHMNGCQILDKNGEWNIPENHPRFAPSKKDIYNKLLELENTQSK